MLRGDPDLYLNWAPLSVSSRTKTCAQTGPRSSVLTGDSNLCLESRPVPRWGPYLYLKEPPNLCPEGTLSHVPVPRRDPSSMPRGVPNLSPCAQGVPHAQREPQPVPPCLGVPQLHVQREIVHLQLEETPSPPSEGTPTCAQGIPHLHAQRGPQPVHLQLKGTPSLCPEGTPTHTPMLGLSQLYALRGP